MSTETTERELPLSIQTVVRTLSAEDKNDLKLALQELQIRYSASGISFFEPTMSHGFTNQLVDDLVRYSNNIFSSDYLQNSFSIYSTQHVIDVLEVFQELFEDIPDFVQPMYVLALLNSEVARAEHYLQAMEVVTCLENAECSSDSCDELDFSLPEFDLQL